VKVAFADGFFDSLKRCFRPWWHPKELRYKFKCWAWKRYSTVKPRTLPHTWCDRCQLLPHMMFEILSQFIEKECSPGHVEWYGEYGHKITVDGKEKYVRDEMQDLYDWWHLQYLKRYPELENKLWEDVRAHADAHKQSDFREEGGMCYWDPQYDTPENAERGKELLMRLHWLGAAAENALNRRLERLLKIRRYMWT
jgi:hypothetical protein